MGSILLIREVSIMAGSSRDLITRKQAAQILDASEKKIQRLTSAGTLKAIYRKRATGGQEAYYRASDIEKLKKMMAPPVAVNSAVNSAVNGHGTKAASKKALPAPRDNDDEPAREGAREKISAVEAAAKLILTLSEAAVLTHIPEDELRRELKAGNLRGVIRGRGWKISRAHLDEYVANLYVPKRISRYVEKPLGKD
jgi:excisionase family DNA binding protein